MAPSRETAGYESKDLGRGHGVYRLSRKLGARMPTPARMSLNFSDSRMWASALLNHSDSCNSFNQADWGLAFPGTARGANGTGVRVLRRARKLSQYRSGS